MRYQRFAMPIQLLWSRISFSTLSVLYFAFSLIHCIVQIGFQIRAYTINVQANNDLTHIVTTAQTFNESLPYLKDSNLHLCSWIPSNLQPDATSCPIIWSDASEADTTRNPSANMGIDASLSTASSRATSTVVPSATPTISVLSQTTGGVRVSDEEEEDDDEPESDDESDASSVFSSDDEEDELEEDDRRRFVRRDLQVTPVQNGASISVMVSGLKGRGDVVIDEQCLWALNWPRSVLHNTEREDIVFIAFNLWVLGVSVIALLHESVPHIMASLVTHIMATAWGAFQITHTANFRSLFGRVITNGACKGTNLLPDYWEARGNAEIPSLVFNGLALIVSAALTWKLMKSFGWQTFKRVGASRTINHVYKLMLLLSITIQLSLFFMAVTVGLWLDQLWNSMIGDKALYVKLYKAASFITLILLVPWFISGWVGVRKELRLQMFIFLALSNLYMAGWGVMFFSTTFRWTFVTWRFFSIMASASIFMTFISVVIGIVCRLNFGKGLSRYLNGAQALPDGHVIPYPAVSSARDVEKVEFPSSNGPLPTFSSFDRRFSQAASSNSGRTLGPRFTNKDAQPFETVPGLPYPAPALKRLSDTSSLYESEKYDQDASHVGMHTPPGYHSRSNSGTSTHSSQTHSTNTHSSQTHGSPRQRWIIE